MRGKQSECKDFTMSLIYDQFTSNFDKSNKYPNRVYALHEFHFCLINFNFDTRTIFPYLFAPNVHAMMGVNHLKLPS